MIYYIRYNYSVFVNNRGQAMFDNVEIESLLISEKIVRGVTVYVIDTRSLYRATKISSYNRKDFGRFATRKEAVAKMNKLLGAYNGNEEIEAQKKAKVITVSDAVIQYLSAQKLLMTKSYHKDQKFNLGLLQQAFYKDIQIDYWNISIIAGKSEREDFRQFIENLILNEGKSIETMFTRRKHFTKFFEAVAKKGWIDANPISDIKLPEKKPTDNRAPKVQKHFTAWLQTDGLDAYSAAYKLAAEKVLAVGRKKYRKRNHLTIAPNKLEMMLLLSMTSGIRQGELRALRRCDYSPNKQKIITRQAVKHSTKEFGDIKTQEGQDREIEVPSEICKMLNKFMQESKFQERDDLIFPSSTGTPLRKNDFSEAMKPIRSACPFIDNDTGLPLHFKWGDLRHVFASNEIDHLGANWHEVSESMGHSNPEFTKKQYGHYIEDEEKSQRKRDARSAILVKNKGR